MRYGAPSRDAQAYREEERLRRRLGEALLDARLVKAHLRVGGGGGGRDREESVRKLFDALGVPLEARFPIPAPAHT